MKKALLKNTLREIKNTKARFISIMLIVALGVGFFVGVKSASPSMEKMAIDYYADTNLMDFKLMSTVGFDDDDVKAIRDTDGVKDVMPSYFLDVSVTHNSVGRIFRLHAVPSKYDTCNAISQIDVVKGRLPEKPGEIAVEESDIRQYNLNEKITIDEKVGDINIKDNLNTLEYTVVGIVRSPMYISIERGTTNVGNGKIDGFAYVTDDSFSVDRYTVVYTTMNLKGENVSPFDDRYDELVDTFSKKLELTADKRVEYFVTENIDKAQKEIDDSNKELKDAKDKADEEFKDAQQKIDDGETEYYSGINSAQSKIDSGQAEIDSSRYKLDLQWGTYNDSVSEFETEIGKAKEEYEAAEAEYEKGLSDIETLKETVKDIEDKKVSGAQETIYGIVNSLPEGIDQTIIDRLNFAAESVTADNAIQILQLVKNESTPFFDTVLDTTITALETADENITELESAIQTGEKELSEARLELDSTKILIEEKESQTKVQLDGYKGQLDKGEKDLSSAQQKIDTSKLELEDAKKEGLEEIEEGKSELEQAKKDAKDEFDKAEKELKDAQEELDSIGEVEWYVFDRTSNSGYGNFEQDANRIDAVATVFPLFFLLVAMLVCLTTMTRLVEEKRTEIGTLKALGYSDASIIAKFVSYSCLAATFGCILGCSLGIPILPNIIYDAYSMLYNMRDIKVVVSQSSLVLAIVSAFVCCAVVTFVVCYKSLKHKPATLMRPKTPKAGKRILLERMTFLWKRFSFSSKVTWRNLFRYKSRLFMTALGIAGCTALMLTAFGLYDSINDVVDLQFNELSDYNTVIVSDKEKTVQEIAPLKEAIDSDKRFDKSAIVMQKNTSVASQTAKKDSDVYLSVSQDVKAFEKMILLRNRQSGEKLSLDTHSAIVTEKLSDLLSVGVGDYITVGEGDDKIKIIGIAENYVANYVYMSKEAYTQMTGEQPKYNTVYANAVDISEEKEKSLGTDYLERDDVAAISFTSSISDEFKDMVSSMNMIVLVMIICAGALAIVVLYNLTNINLAERNREIATIKVLGFYHNETSSFVYRENIILTLFGIAVGLVLGVWLWQFVVATVEVDAIMFGKSIHTISYVISAVLTGLFSLVVNFIMYFRIKAINMVESLKSIE